MTNNELDTLLCRDISGFNSVSERFSASAMSALEGAYGIADLNRLREAYRRHGASGLTEIGSNCITLARALIMFLYVGKLDGRPADEDDYFESLIWQAMLAHPPALSGGYFGYWRYPPEQSNGN